MAATWGFGASARSRSASPTGRIGSASTGSPTTRAIFIPFLDATNGTETYGGGRYLCDSAKGADLGSVGDELVLDFNYAYHPSCAFDARWSCPLAPPANRISAPIRAGERLVGVTRTD